MSSLGSGEKGERAGEQERGREGGRARGDGEDVGKEGGNRPPTDHPTKEQTAAAVVDVGDDDHIAAYIHYPNTFSIVAGITPRRSAPRPLARLSLASSLKPPSPSISLLGRLNLVADGRELHSHFSTL